MSQARARVAAFEDRQLLTKGKVLKDEIATGAESRAKGAEEAQEDGSHHVTMPQVRRDRRQFSAMGAWPTPLPSAMEATRIGFWPGTAGATNPGHACRGTPIGQPALSARYLSRRTTPVRGIHRILLRRRTLKRETHQILE